MQTLETYGWNDYFAGQIRAETTGTQLAGRVTADFGSILKVVTPEERTATITGRLLHASGSEGLPKVGDWVTVRPIGQHEAVIESVLSRKSEIARRAAGEKTVKQIMAANVDIAFVLQSLDNDFSPGRLQRYLYQLAVGHIRPVVVLNKADKIQDPEPYTSQMQSLAIPYIICSARTGSGVDAIVALIEPGATAVLIGSSGVGKSTLTNRLLGTDIQKTHDVRASDSTGQHTTIHRELFVLPNGGLLIDTPGIRELQLWGETGDLSESFDDIIELTTQCTYANCRHGSEPGCAVRAALATGKITKAHYANYTKMEHELQVLHVTTAAQTKRHNRRHIPSASRRANKQLDDEDMQELEP